MAFPPLPRRPRALAGILHKQPLRAANGCCLIALVALGCVVEERKFSQAYADSLDDDDDDDDDDDIDAGDDSSEGVQTTAACKEYCANAMSACTGDDQLYSSEASCQGLCNHLPEGKAGVEDVNTVACRSLQAKSAKMAEPQFYCPAASPGGRGETADRSKQCGTNCQSYCLLHASLCDIEDEIVLEQDECERKCEGLPDAEDYNVITHHEGDTVQCRLVHLSSAALSDEAAREHCPHSRLVPAAGDWCTAPTTVSPSCDDYCKLVMVACSGENAVYASATDCQNTCAELDPGTNADLVENTVGCRNYHAHSALLRPVDHCPHAGPAGDGHCGITTKSGPTGNCESYCRIARAACEEEFSETFADLEECESTCSELPGAQDDQGYTLSAASSGKSVQCRIARAVEALESGTCDGVFGGTPCTN